MITQRTVNFWLTREIWIGISWNQVPLAERYNIYRNAALTDRIASITTSEPRSYEIHGAKKGEVYYITWEDTGGVQQGSTAIIVN